jgi:sugar phosphate isomerase/epimerase
MKTYKIGFPNNPRKNLSQEIEWIGENRFDFVDLFLEEDEAVPEKIDPEKIRALLKKYQLEAIGHTAWYLPIGSPIRAIRDCAVSEAERYFKVFAALGTKCVTLHANWPRGMFTVREGLNFQVETLRRLVDLGNRYKLEIMYEPVDSEADSLENVSRILERVPGLWFHIDIGHANLFGRNPADFIRQFRAKLRHVHLHDNDRRRDLHLPLGAGRLDLDGVINALKKYYQGTITLEIFSQDKEYILFSRDKLSRLLDAY